MNGRRGLARRWAATSHRASTVVVAAAAAERASPEFCSRSVHTETVPTQLPFRRGGSKRSQRKRSSSSNITARPRSLPLFKTRSKSFQTRSVPHRNKNHNNPSHRSLTLSETESRGITSEARNDLHHAHNRSSVDSARNGEDDPCTFPSPGGLVALREKEEQGIIETKAAAVHARTHALRAYWNISSSLPPARPSSPSMAPRVVTQNPKILLLPLLLPPRARNTNTILRRLPLPSSEPSPPPLPVALVCPACPCLPLRCLVWRGLLRPNDRLCERTSWWCRPGASPLGTPATGKSCN